MHQRLQYKTWNFETTTGKHRWNTLRHRRQRGFLKGLSMKYKIRIYKLDFIKLIFFHYSKGRYDRVEKYPIFYRMENNLCQLFVWQGINIQDIWKTPNNCAGYFYVTWPKLLREGNLRWKCVFIKSVCRHTCRVFSKLVIDREGPSP